MGGDNFGEKNVVDVVNAPLLTTAFPKAAPRSRGAVQMLNARLSGILTCRRQALVSHRDTERSRTSPQSAPISFRVIRAGFPGTRLKE